MFNTSHTRRGRFLLLAFATASALSMPLAASAASAQTGNFSLNESTQTVSGAYSTGRATQEYRFMGGNNKPTQMSFNWCSNYSNYNSASYPAGDLTYHALGSWLNGTCLKLRGRTAPGYGSIGIAYGNMLY